MHVDTCVVASGDGTMHVQCGVCGKWTVAIEVGDSLEAIVVTHSYHENSHSER